MSQKFQVTAELKLVEPRNLRSVAANLHKALNGPINQGTQRTNANYTRGLQQVATQLNSINSKMKTTQRGTSSLGTQMSHTGKQINVAANEMRRFGAQAAIASRRFLAFALPVGALFKFVGALKQGIVEAVKYQHVNVRIAQVAQKSTSQLRDLNSQISKLAKNFGVSSASLQDVSQTLIQAGLSAKDTKVAMDALAKSDLSPTFENMRDTTEGAIAIFGQFKTSAADLEKQLGSISAVSAKYAVESSDLITAVRKSGGVFKQAGGSLNELLGLFTSVRGATRESADSIATAFRTIFARLQSPGRIRKLESLLNIKLSNGGQFVGPIKAIKALNEALRDVPDGSILKAAVAEEVGGIRQLGKAIPLINNYAQAIEAIGVAEDGQTSLQRDMITSQESLIRQLSKVKEHFLDLFRTIVGSSTFKTVTSMMLRLAEAALKLSDAFVPLLPALTTFAAIKFARQVGPFASGYRHPYQQQRKFATGGVVPGSGSGDTVPAMLTPGEFVVSKAGVQHMGEHMLSRLNSGGGPSVRGGIQHFARGSKKVVDPVTGRVTVYPAVPADSGQPQSQNFVDTVKSATNAVANLGKAAQKAGYEIAPDKAPKGITQLAREQEQAFRKGAHRGKGRTHVRPYRLQGENSSQSPSNDIGPSVVSPSNFVYGTNSYAKASKYYGAYSVAPPKSKSTYGFQSNVVPPVDNGPIPLTHTVALPSIPLYNPPVSDTYNLMSNAPRANTPLSRRLMMRNAMAIPLTPNSFDDNALDVLNGGNGQFRKKPTYGVSPIFHPYKNPRERISRGRGYLREDREDFIRENGYGDLLSRIRRNSLQSQSNATLDARGIDRRSFLQRQFSIPTFRNLYNNGFGAASPDDSMTISSRRSTMTRSQRISRLRAAGKLKPSLLGRGVGHIKRNMGAYGNTALWLGSMGLSSVLESRGGKTAAIGGSALNMAMVGGSVGALAGPWGAAAGALAGAAYGAIKGLKDFNENLKSEKLDKSLKNLASSAEQFTKVVTENGNIKESLGQLNVSQGRATMDLISKHGDDNAARYEGMEQIYGSSVETFRQLRQKRLSDQLEKGIGGGFIGSAEGNATHLQIAQYRAAKKVKEIVSARPETGKMSANHIYEELVKKFVVEEQNASRALQDEISKRIQLNMEIRQTANSLESQTIALDKFVQSLESLQSKSGGQRNTRELILGGGQGGYANAATNHFANGIEFGSPDFESQIGMVNRLAPGKFNAEGLLRTNQISNVLRESLPSMVSRHSEFAGEGGLDKFMEEIEGQLHKGGIGSDTKEFKEVMNSFQKEFESDPEKLEKNLQLGLKGGANLQKSIQEMVEAATSHYEGIRTGAGQIGKIHEDEMNRFQGELGNLFSAKDASAESRNQAGILGLQSQRFQAERSQRRFGGDITSYLSPSAANAEFARHQQELTGLGVNAQNPQAILASALQSHAGAVAARQQQENPNIGVTTENATALRSFESQTNNSVRALKNLADASNKNAALQERLAALDRDQDSRMGLAEKFFSSDAEGRHQIQQEAAAAIKAIQHGTLDTLSIKEQQQATSFLGSAGDVRLLGGEKTGKDYLKDLIANSRQGKHFLQNAKDRAEAGGLEREILTNMKTAVQAQNALTTFMERNQGEFFANLSRNQADFLSALSGTLKGQQVDFKPQAMPANNQAAPPANPTTPQSREAAPQVGMDFSSPMAQEVFKNADASMKKKRMKRLRQIRHERSQHVKDINELLRETVSGNRQVARHNKKIAQHEAAYENLGNEYSDLLSQNRKESPGGDRKAIRDKIAYHRSQIMGFTSDKEHRDRIKELRSNLKRPMSQKQTSYQNIREARRERAKAQKLGRLIGSRGFKRLSPERQQEAIEGFQESTRKLRENAVRQTDNSAATFDKSVGLFASNVASFERAASAIPHTIDMKGTHEVNVNINGADVLARLAPQIQEMVASTAESVVREKIAGIMPEAGVANVA